MKCIKNENTGLVTRVSDEKAAKAVKGGIWHYVSKSAWKAAGRPR